MCFKFSVFNCILGCPDTNSQTKVPLKVLIPAYFNLLYLMQHMFFSYGKAGKFTKQLWNIPIEICAFFIQQPADVSPSLIYLHFFKHPIHLPNAYVLLNFSPVEMYFTI